MHVLILPSWYPSADDAISGSFFREQALALSSVGCTVGVLSVQPGGERVKGRTQKGGASEFCDNGVDTFVINASGWKKGSNLLSVPAWRKYGYSLFHQYVQKHGRPDVVHAHSIFGAGFLAEKIHARHRIPYLLTEHSSSFRKPLIGLIRKSVSRGVVGNAAARVAVSSAYANLLEGVFGSKRGTWEVVPNIVDEVFFQQAARQGFSASEGREFVFVSIALLSGVKNMQLVLRSFAGAFAARPNIRLRVVGEGPDREKLEALSQELGLQEQIEFSGLMSRGEIPGVMASSDALVVGSDFESFGITLIEALATGMPVVATDCGGPADIVNEDNGYLVPIGDVAAMSSAMIALHDKYNEFDFSAISRECRQKYSAAAVTARLIDTYRQAT